MIDHSYYFYRRFLSDKLSMKNVTRHLMKKIINFGFSWFLIII